jgi:hypothetical protein
MKRLGSKNFPEGRELTKDDYVIIVGDFGLVWNIEGFISKEEIYWTKWLTDKPWTTLFIDGNHENFDRLDKLESTNMFNADVGIVNDSIFHLRRGRVYQIGDIKTFVMGGAMSIDKESRSICSSWWPQEIPSWAEFDFGLTNLEKHGHEVDLILTHTMPLSIISQMFGDCYDRTKAFDPTCKYLDAVRERTNFQRWFCGHFHDDIILDRFTLIYESIIGIS